MKFINSRFKVEEAKYFLKRIKEVYNGDEIITNYYVNAFISSSISIPDYIIQDFFNEIELSLDNKDFLNNTKTFREKIKEIDENKKQVLLDFKEKNNILWKDFLKNPFNHYFKKRRNVLIHNKAFDSGMHSLTRIINGKHSKTLFLESADSIEVIMTDPSKQTDFGHTLSDEKRQEHEYKLHFTDMYPILTDFFHQITTYLEFHEKEYSDFSWNKNKSSSVDF